MRNAYDVAILSGFNDWETFKSNTIHLKQAIKLSEQTPVIFIQTKKIENYQFENSELRNITILHIKSQSHLKVLQRALIKNNFIKPLFVSNGPKFPKRLQELYHVGIIQLLDLINIPSSSLEFISQSKDKINYDYPFDVLVLSHSSFLEAKLKNFLLFKRLFNIKESLIKLSKNSRHFFHYVSMDLIKDFRKFNTSNFEVIILHLSCDILNLSKAAMDILKNHPGYKLLLLDEEHINLNDVRNLVQILGIHTVYTAIPAEHIRSIFSVTRFPSTEFRSLEKFNNLKNHIPFPCREDAIVATLKNAPFPTYSEELYLEINALISSKNFYASKSILFYFVRKYKIFNYYLDMILREAGYGIKDEYLKIKIKLQNMYIACLCYINEINCFFMNMLKTSSCFVLNFLKSESLRIYQQCFKIKTWVLNFSLQDAVINLLPISIRQMLIKLLPKSVKIFLRQTLSLYLIIKLLNLGKSYINQKNKIFNNEQLENSSLMPNVSIRN